MWFGLSGARLRRAITSLKRRTPSVFPLCALQAGYARQKKSTGSARLLYGGLRPPLLLMFAWAAHFRSRSRPAPAVLVLVAAGGFAPGPPLVGSRYHVHGHDNGGALRHPHLSVNHSYLLLHVCSY